MALGALAMCSLHKMVKGSRPTGIPSPKASSSAGKSITRERKGTSYPSSRRPSSQSRKSDPADMQAALRSPSDGGQGPGSSSIQTRSFRPRVLGPMSSKGKNAQWRIFLMLSDSGLTKTYPSVAALSMRPVWSGNGRPRATLQDQAALTAMTLSRANETKRSRSPAHRIRR